jgi:hypothetical protein
MENLKFGIQDAQAYDFKGSPRNRQDEHKSLALDGNYRTESVENQLCMTTVEKTSFLEVIETDVELLATNRVMDYSPVVIICRKERRVRFGIVHYCRAYTFDEVFESIMKQMLLYTEYTTRHPIISPTDYRERFVEAMCVYFHATPAYSNINCERKEG